MIEIQNQRLVFRHRHQTLWVEPWGPGTVRVWATMNAEMPERPWSLLPAGESRAEVRAAGER